MRSRISETLLASPRRIARPFRALRLWVLLAGVAIATSSALFLRAQLDGRRGAEEQKLLAIADLQGRDLERWREGLERHAASVARQPGVGKAAEEIRAGDRGASGRARPILREIAAAERYRTARLVALDATVLASSCDDEHRQLAPGLRAVAVDALARRHIVIAEPMSDAAGTTIVTVVPVNGRRGTPVGAVVLESSGEEVVFRAIRRWPLPSATGEIRIVRSDGARAEVLSPPTIDPSQAASAAALVAGGRREAEGETEPPALVRPAEVDGRAVLSAVRPVGGTDWSLVATVDTAEVDQPTWAIAGEVVATATSVFLATVAALVVAAHRRAAEVRSREAALEHARRLAQHARLLDSTMAHELNGPLACMLTNARYALDELRRRPGVHLEDAAEALEDAVDATLRAAEVVRQLHDFAEAGSPAVGIADDLC